MRKVSAWVIVACLHPAAAGVFAGRVVEDHSGNPLSRVEIRITRPHTAGIVAEMETDANGRFRTPDLPDVECILRFSKTSYATVETTTRARSEMLLRLVRCGAIAGKIADSEGRPVPYAQVVALTPSDAIAGTVDQNSARGEYRIYGLPPGSYQVAILTTGENRPRRGVLIYPNNSRPRDFTVAGGEDYTGADFILPTGPAFTVAAKVDVSQTRPPIFTFVSADRPGLRLAQGVGRPDGAFTVEDVLPGDYELLATVVSPGNPSVFGRARVTVVASNVEGAPVSLDQVRSASFTLRTQEPCGSDAVVELTAAEAWLPNAPVSAVLQAHKPASLTGLAPARYSIAARAPRGNCYATTQPVLDLTRDSASQPVEVVLAPPGSIGGHLTGAARPADYVVVLMPRDGSLQRIALPDEKGQFTFPDLAPGAYALRAAGPNDRWAPTPGRAPPLTEVSAGPPTPLELHVTEVSR
ncbi:MAG: carboxypeptidase regulatory-like domain-containing protein [Bryobacteraceae bacterium]